MPKRRQEPEQPEAATQVRLEVVPRRGVSRIEAARYVGISTTKFDELVRDGQMPQPFRIGSRTIWDLRKIDLAFDELSGLDVEDSFADWDAAASGAMKFVHQTPAEFDAPNDTAAIWKAARRKSHPLLMSKDCPGYPNVYTTESLAKRWTCSTSHIRNLIRSGNLKTLKTGSRTIRITAATVVAYEDANTIEARR